MIENHMIRINTNDPNDPHYTGDPLCSHCNEPFDDLIEIDGLELCETCLDVYKWSNNINEDEDGKEN